MIFQDPAKGAEAMDKAEEEEDLKKKAEVVSTNHQ